MDAISMISEFTHNISPEEFVHDKKTLHACLMVLVHLWEIFAKMQRNGWDLWINESQKIIDMRNFLAHQYIDIRPSLIVKTVYEDIPQLEKLVRDRLP
jgi:uncharacterized protein with HEPN domain